MLISTANSLVWVISFFIVFCHTSYRAWYSRWEAFREVFWMSVLFLYIQWRYGAHAHPTSFLFMTDMSSKNKSSKWVVSSFRDLVSFPLSPLCILVLISRMSTRKYKWMPSYLLYSICFLHKHLFNWVILPRLMMNTTASNPHKCILLCNTKITFHYIYDIAESKQKSFSKSLHGSP